MVLLDLCVDNQLFCLPLSYGISQSVKRDFIGITNSMKTPDKVISHKRGFGYCGAKVNTFHKVKIFIPSTAGLSNTTAAELPTAIRSIF